MITCAGSSAIPIPVLANRGIDDPTWETLDQFVEDKLKRNPYRNQTTGKINKAVFRGEISGKSCWSGSPSSIVSSSKDCGRRKLMKKAAQRPDLIDFSFKYLPLMEQEKFRLTFVAEGHCGWVDRLKFLLHMSPTAVLQETFCHEWYHGGLTAWEHYIPVDYHLQNLFRNIDFAMKNIQMLNNISRNANDFASSMLSKKTQVAYFVITIEEWTSRLQQGENIAYRKGAERGLDYLRRVEEISQMREVLN